jgi:hypothetical protein
MEEIEFAGEQNPEPHHDEKSVDISHIKPVRYRYANTLSNYILCFQQRLI